VGLHCFRHLGGQLNSAMDSVNRYFVILIFSFIFFLLPFEDLTWNLVLLEEDVYRLVFSSVRLLTSLVFFAWNDVYSVLAFVLLFLCTFITDERSKTSLQFPPSKPCQACLKVDVWDGRSFYVFCRK